MKLDPELERYRSLMPAPASWADGFSMRSVIGCIFIGLVMMPASMYLGLMMGRGLNDAARWVTVILFVELARRSYTTLSRPEIFILFYMAGAVLASPFSSLFWTQYFVTSDAAVSTGIADHIPAWHAPSRDVIEQRNFFHPGWLGPILMIVLGQFLGRLDRFGLGYVLFRVTSDVEKLPFPMAAPGAAGITALAESSDTPQGAKTDSWRWRVFSIGSMIGLVFGALYVGIPAISSAFLKQPINLIEPVFLDFTDRTGGLLPATPVTLSLDLGNIMIGMVLPFSAVIGSFLGMLLTWIANPILHHYGLIHQWRPDMNALDTAYFNHVDFYLSFGIGISLAVALVGFYQIAKILRRGKPAEAAAGAREPPAWKRLFQPPPGRGDIPLWGGIAIYLFSTTTYVVLCHFLVPDFPWWILAAYGYLYTPVVSYVAARMEGVAGHWQEIPYLREATFIAASTYGGYRGVGIWFAPLPMNNYAGSVMDFRVQELTGTRFTSLWKAEFIVFPVVIVSSIFFAQYFWSMARIPSAQYQHTNRYFEFNARQQALLQSATLGEGHGTEFYRSIQWKVILSGTGIGTIAFAALSWAKAPTMLIYGLIRGLGTGIAADMFPQLLGALLSRYYFEKRFGLRWREYAPVLLAGFSCGMGLISMFSLGCLLIAKSVFQLPY
jgi:hypothetical protein